MAARSRNSRSLGDRYLELFQPVNDWRVSGDTSSLEQPGPLKVVPSVVTHGAYEAPILGGQEDSSAYHATITPPPFEAGGAPASKVARNRGG